VRPFAHAEITCALFMIDSFMLLVLRVNNLSLSEVYQFTTTPCCDLETNFEQFWTIFQIPKKVPFRQRRARSSRNTLRYYYYTYKS